MKTHIVHIGNSQGIRLQKTLFQEAQLEDKVELQAEPGRILIEYTHPTGPADPLDLFSGIEDPTLMCWSWSTKNERKYPEGDSLRF